MTSPMTLAAKPTATASALALRPWQESDIPDVVAAHRDESMRRWLMRSVGDEDEARAWLAHLDTGWTDKTLLNWAVEEEGAVAGYFVIKCGCVLAPVPPKCSNEAHRSRRTEQHRCDQ
jgi:RimJ/RimL family protein N-acetyltransferase